MNDQDRFEYEVMRELYEQSLINHTEYVLRHDPAFSCWLEDREKEDRQAQVMSGEDHEHKPDETE